MHGVVSGGCIDIAFTLGVQGDLIQKAHEYKGEIAVS